MDYREELLTMRDQAMQNIVTIVDEFFADTWGGEYIEDRDELVTEICDMICETIDPAGF